MAGPTIKNWQKFGLCVIRKIDPEKFFIADTNAPLRDRLRSICRVCPVRRICLEQNLLVADGMFGGFTRKERMNIAIRRGIPYEQLPTTAKELIANRKSMAKTRGQNNANR